jgi:DNA end-binding protein Ku
VFVFVDARVATEKEVEMPRSIWTGAISFGLVNIPIKLVTAVDSKDVSFRQIRRSDNSRIRHRKVAAADGEEVSTDEIVKGFEIAPDRYVVVEPDELKGLDPEASKTIEIEDFVDLADVDPIYFDSSYYLEPQPTAAKPYRLLHESMRRSGKAAVARFVLRTKQYLALIRPLGDALAVSTLIFHDEVVPASQLDVPDPDEVAVTDRELAMAEQLIASMATDWEPQRYADTYRQKVLELIEAKAEGQDIVAVPEAERESGEVVDLMAALEASLQAAKDQASTGDEPAPAQESA